MPSEPRAGSMLLQYRLDEVIGRGGMGLVYLAFDTRLERRVAVKIMAPQVASDESFRVRFEREARMAAAIDHPNIIPIYDTGEAQGVLYLAMRYVQGTDLRSLIVQGGALSPDRAVSVLRQVASALDAAHAQGIVHRDVKPANILIASGSSSDDADHVYLTDFGLTKRFSQASRALTATGQFVGTIDYVAPEQIEGRDVDGRADEYSLGCVMYECLTGVVPFVETSDIATLFAHVHQPAPTPSQVRPDLPPGVDQAIGRAMAKAPGARFPSCGEFVMAVRDAFRGAAAGPISHPPMPVPPPIPPAAMSARPVPRGAAPGQGTDPDSDAMSSAGLKVPPAAPTAQPQRTVAAKPPPGSTPHRRGAALGAIGAVLVVVVVAIGIVLLLPKGKSTPPPKHGTTAPTTPPSSPPVHPTGIQLAWTAVPTQADLGGAGAQVMNAMTQNKTGTLLAGGSSDTDAAAWRSPDGTRWTRVTGQADLGGPGDQQISGIVTVKGGGYVAVGSDTSSGNEDAAVWTSSDGKTWTRVDDAPLGGPGDQVINRASGTGASVGILAVGSTTNTADGTQDGAIWSSTDDGRHWTLEPVGGLGGPGDQDVKRVTVLRSGSTRTYVAVGTSTLDGDIDAAVWTSPDGTNWTRVSDPSGALGGPGDQGMTDVQTFGDELIAGGFASSDDGLDGAVWISDDGTVWIRVQTDALGGAGDQVIDRLFTTTPVPGPSLPPIVAAGTSTVDGNQDAVIWYSANARKWNREVSTEQVLGGPGAQTINTIAQDDATLVAVGSNAASGDDDAGVWTAKPQVGPQGTPSPPASGSAAP
ncbi:MAG TPA: protein kinase [Actinomycetota bacterium]